MESNSKNKPNIDKDNSTDNNNNISRNMKGKTLSLSQESDLSEFIRENNKLSSPVNNKNIILLLFYI
jgi:BRCT domain type II-containing protein